MRKGASLIRIFAIADLHLSFGVNKPMSVFGDLWVDYEQKLEREWRKLIHVDDLVIIAGDISWAMRDAEVQPDLSFLRSLPGEKILLRGNHDYWWGTRKKVQELAGHGFHVLHNNALSFSGVTFVGTRGWELPESPRYIAKEDESIYLREIERLRLSLIEGKKSGQPLFAITHYPPLLSPLHRSGFAALLEDFGVTTCVYGHLHGQAHQSRVEGLVRHVDYYLVSGDFLNFVPREIPFFH